MPKAPTKKVIERKEEILALLQKRPLTTSKIADILDCTLSMAYYSLKLLRSEGKVECRRGGKALVWMLK